MILVRHGQSRFNVVFSVTRVDPGIRDPGLTDAGHGQAAQAAARLHGDGPDGLLPRIGRGRLTRILASPYRRTLETAEILARRLGLPVTVEPMVRERNAYICDIGSAPAELIGRWPAFAFEAVPDHWWHGDQDQGASESEDSLLRRCARFRAHMAQQPDWATVVVVTHWGFIRGLTGHEAENGQILAYDPADGRVVAADDPC